jgi:hypothetical protein
MAVVAAATVVMVACRMAVDVVRTGPRTVAEFLEDRSF